jgi:hypothetical protein
VKVAKFAGIIVVLLLLAGGGALFFINPEVEIQGVEDGAVYAKEQKVNVTGKWGDVVLTINEKKEPSGKMIEDNGQYEITAVETFLWKEARKSMTVTIDDVPPFEPSFQHVTYPVYFKEAKMTVGKQRGVEYTGILNGEDFDLDQAIIEPGEYELTVTARKPNGLTSEKTIQFSVDNTTYTEEQINRFMEFYFPGKERVGLTKWTEDVDVRVYGTPNQQDLKVLAKNIEELNQLIPIELVLVEEGEGSNTNKLDIHYIPTHDFDTIGSDFPVVSGDVWTVGVTIPISHDYKGLKKMVVGIGTDISQPIRDGTTAHELLHAMGLFYHVENDSSSVITEIEQGITEMSQSDKDLVTLLYREELFVGYDQYTVERMLNERKER